MSTGIRSVKMVLKQKNKRCLLATFLLLARSFLVALIVRFFSFLRAIFHVI